jgi:uncharacterized membrane protein YtjA (UPF0391 family)
MVGTQRRLAICPRETSSSTATREDASDMLKWALIFLAISLIAGALGFTGLAAGAARIAKILFGIFLAIFLILLILALLAGEALL